ASAGASSRKAIRFSAPRGSPAARARAAAVISESIGIPPHLSLPSFRYPALSLSRDQRPPSRIEKRREARRKETRAMTTHKIGTRDQWLAGRLGLLEAGKDLTRPSDQLARRRQELRCGRIDNACRY